MSILTSYATFRTVFAGPGGPLALDQLPEWPYATLVRANSIPGIVCAETFGPWLIGLSINDFDLDAVEHVHEYDWFVSQRATDPAGQPFTIEQYQSFEAGSGSIRFLLNPWAEALYPDPFDDEIAELLWGNIWAYCRRRSDGAIQVLDVYKCVLENLVTPGN